MDELAAEISAASGKSIEYRDLPADQYADLLTGAGVPEGFAQILADTDLGIGRGDLLVTTGDLRKLIGRPATALSVAVRSAAAGI